MFFLQVLEGELEGVSAVAADDSKAEGKVEGGEVQSEQVAKCTSTPNTASTCAWHP